MRHEWEREVITPEEAKDNPWALFNEIPLAPNGSYDGPARAAWGTADYAHNGPQCEVCGFNFCASCDWDLWVAVATGVETLECAGTEARSPDS